MRPARGAPTHVAIVEGANEGETVSLDEAPILIGRGSDAAIRLDDDYVSTRHARIASSGDQWFVEDLGSRNTTFLNERPLAGPAASSFDVFPPVARPLDGLEQRLHAPADASSHHEAERQGQPDGNGNHRQHGP